MITAATPIRTPEHRQRRAELVRRRSRPSARCADVVAPRSSGRPDVDPRRPSPSRSRTMRLAHAAMSCSWVISDDRPAVGVQLAEHRHHLLRRGRVEVARRLVGEHQRRVRHDRPGERDALLLAARQLVREVAAAVGQPDRVERLDRPLSPLPRLNARVEQRQLDVRERRRARDQVEGLEDEADLAAADAGQVGLVERRGRRSRRARTGRASGRRGSR